MSHGSLSLAGRKPLLQRLKRDITTNWQIYIMLIPAVIAIIMFAYVPMYGVQMAFKDFKPIKGIWGSEWVGFAHFQRFFKGHQFRNLLENTLYLSVFGIIAGFPAPIMLALMINQIRAERFKKVLQTVTYMPHFISTVVMVGMIIVFFTPSTGLFGHLGRALGVTNPPNLLASKTAFRPLYIATNIWQHMGWDSIIYLAALSAVDMALYEAAVIDGASRFQCIVHIDIPCILPTVVILLILSAGRVMNVSFDKVFLMQNDLNLPVSETIATYVYKIGLKKSQYSYSAAVNLFNTIVSFVLVLMVNTVSKRLGETSLW